MNRTLHITNHIGTIANINNVFKLLGEPSKLSTIKYPLPLHINSDYANILWNHYASISNDFDTVIITDIALYARPFLQNMDKHSLHIIIYVTNRFDWGLFSKNHPDYPYFIDLYRNWSKTPRVTFCADNRYDQYYCQLENVHFYYKDIIRLTPPLREPVASITQRAFLHARGTPIYFYGETLSNQGVEYDIFGPGHTKYRDTSHIAEYKAIIHLPYQSNIQSLWENLGYSIVYCIPSQTFLEQLVFENHWYFWEEYQQNWEYIKKDKEIVMKSISLAEWYQPELADMFVFFDSWEDLGEKWGTVDFESKKSIIWEYMNTNNQLYANRWKRLLMSRY